MLKQIQVLEDGKVPTKEARNWRIEEQKKNNREKSIRGFCISLKGEVSWREKHCGTSREKICCRMEERCLRKNVTLLERTRRCFKKISWQLVEEGWRGQERKKNGRRKRTKEEVGKKRSKKRARR